jgi:hypothetical protein
MPKLQNTITLSTTKEQYIVVSHACKEAIWLKGILGEFGKVQDKINVLCDSQSDIHLDINLAYHNKTKCIAIK